MSEAPVVTFDRLVPGTDFGTRTFACSPEALDRWRRIYPELPLPADGTVPPGLAAPIVMMAYGTLVAPRPAGNVHASQTFRWHRRARVGEVLTTAVRVLRAEVKGERRWVTIATLTSDAAGRPVLEGELVTLWAR